MNRYECFEFLVPSMTDQLVVGSLSGQRVEWGHLSRHPGNLLIATMGAALGMGIGLALVLPHRKVIVLESGDRRLGLVVDELTGQQDIVVKQFDAVRGSAAIFSGATILPDGSPALILDVGSLL